MGRRRAEKGEVGGGHAGGEDLRRRGLVRGRDGRRWEGRQLR